MTKIHHSVLISPRMKNFQDLWKQRLHSVLNERYTALGQTLEVDAVVAETPPKPDMGDLAFPMFGYAKVLRLAPPLLAKKDEKGRLIKQRFGPWMSLGFRLLAPLKVLRGTALDIFGYSEERQGERALVQNYMQTLERMLTKLSATTLPDALRFAKLPEEIRGYGHVKARHIAAVKPSWEGLGGNLR